MSETITVTGNITSDPEQRTYRGDDTVTSFRIAASHRRYDAAAGAWITAYTNFYSVSAFRSLGENAFAALSKGQRVIVTGRLRMKEWDNGTKRGVTAEIDAEGIGHDLLFGVTTFVRAGGAPDRAGGEPVESAPASASATDGDGWTIPSMSTSTSTLTEPVRVSADTPF